jgi:hypothetical protein
MPNGIIQRGREMRIDRIIWDLESEVGGNVQHIAEHDITPEEVDEVLYAADEEAIVPSFSSGSPIAFGHTSTGKYIAVVFVVVEDFPFTVRPVTAYEVEE